MAITWVSAKVAEGTSTTMPTHAVGDLLVIVAMRFASATIPSLPSGWTSVATNGATYGCRIGWRVATSAAMGSGTWTNAEDLNVAVYRGAAVGSAAIARGSIPALTLAATDGTSWVSVSEQAGSLPGVPVGCTSRAASSYGRVSDTAGEVPSWAAQATTAGMSTSVEIRDSALYATLDVTTSWEVAARVEVDVTTSWEVDTLYATLDVTTSWEVAARVEVDVTTSWEVEALPGWRDLIVSDRWIQAVTNRVRETRTRFALVDHTHRPVTALDRYGDPLGVPRVVAGEVSMNGESDEMWSCSLTIEDERWVPRTALDPLHPKSPYRVALYWQVRLTDTLWGELPIGVYRTGRPRIADKGAVSVTVDGHDVMSVAKRGGYGGQVIDVGGLTADAALRRLFGTVAPTVPFRAAATGVILPSVYELGRRKPSEDWAELAGIGWPDARIAADREGYATAGPRPDPQTAAIRLVEGPDCTMTTLDREISDTWYNRVVVTGTHPDLTEPVFGMDEDPDEIAAIGLSELAIDSDVVTTSQAAVNLARMHRGRWSRSAETITAAIRPRPDLDYLDVADVARAKSAVAGQWRVSSWRLPLPLPGRPPGLMPLEFMTRQAVV